jgi:hypothetical protein
MGKSGKVLMMMNNIYKSPVEVLLELLQRVQFQFFIGDVVGTSL